MGWCTTSDLDRFLTAAGGYLRSKAAENTLLLSAAQAARETEAARGTRAARDTRASRGTGAAPDARGSARAELLFGWWEPPDGTDPRGAFLHDPAVPLLIAGTAPETAAALAAALARTGRYVSGVDGPIGAADAFAAAWSQRAGVTVRMHRQSRVYRIAGAMPEHMGPAGRYRVATETDRPLLVQWLRAFGTEVGELSGAPEAAAADLLGYGGVALWEAAGRPVAMAAITRPVAGIVRISMVYTPPVSRHNGYAAALTLAISHAALASGRASEVVMITDGNRPERQAARLGYQLIGERAVLRFGPPTAPLPRLKTGPMARIPTGPMPRLRG